jgi:hypothetical protein
MDQRYVGVQGSRRDQKELRKDQTGTKRTKNRNREEGGAE